LESELRQRGFRDPYDEPLHQEAVRLMLSREEKERGRGKRRKTENHLLPLL